MAFFLGVRCLWGLGEGEREKESTVNKRGSVSITRAVLCVFILYICVMCVYVHVCVCMYIVYNYPK